MTARFPFPALLAGALLACSGRPTPPDSEAPVDTGPPAGAACALDGDNALLVWCSATLDEADTPTLVLSAPGVPERRFETQELAREHQVLAWGLKPDTEYSWSFGPFTGVVRTDPLPPAFSAAVLQVEGTLTGMDAVLTPLRCVEGIFAMVDGDGDIVWYLYEPMYLNAMNAYDWSAEDQSLMVGRGGQMVERTLSGETVLTLEHPAYDGELHHDLERHRGLTYLLTDAPSGELSVDSVHVFDGETRLGTFRLEDHFTVTGEPVPGPTGADWSHGNGIEATEDGLIVLSLRALDTVLAFDGDPASPTFLDLRWRVSGSDRGPAGPDFTTEPGEGFVEQHNASVVGDALYLFDNSSDPNASAASRYRFGDQGTVVREQRWSFGQHCPFQGGAEPVGDGGVLATCAPSWRIWQFAPDEPDPVFTLRPICDPPLGPLGAENLNRAIPIWF